jgi:hypothetical protein
VPSLGDSRGKSGGSSGKPSSALLVALGALIILVGVVLAILFGISAYFMITRPVHSVGHDANPTGALAIGIAFSLGVVFGGVLFLRRGLR